MNERPTPETNKLVSTWVPVETLLDFARRLERERDEAREAFTIATDQLVQAQMENRKLHEELKETRQDRDHATARFVAVNAENRRLHEEIQRLRDIEP